MNNTQNNIAANPRIEDYPDVLDVKMIAELLGVSTKTARKTISTKIDHERVGREYRVTKMNLVNYLSGQKRFSVL